MLLKFSLTAEDKKQPKTQLITKRRSLTDASRWVYCLLGYATSEDNVTTKDNLTIKDTPPPTYFSSPVESSAETITGREKEVSLQQFNTHSTLIQQPPVVDLIKNAPSQDERGNTESQQVIQQTTKDEGERGCFEQVESEDMLQNASEQESKSVEVQTKRLSKGWNKQNPFQVGEQIIDILTRIRGVVVGVEREKVFVSGKWGHS